MARFGYPKHAYKLLKEAEICDLGRQETEYRSGSATNAEDMAQTTFEMG
jgi:hypothetical protein